MLDFNLVNININSKNLKMSKRKILLFVIILLFLVAIFYFYKNYENFKFKDIIYAYVKEWYKEIIIAFLFFSNTFFIFKFWQVRKKEVKVETNDERKIIWENLDRNERAVIVKFKNLNSVPLNVDWASVASLVHKGIIIQISESQILPKGIKLSNFNMNPDYREFLGNL
jgi:hypothetical protein